MSLATLRSRMAAIAGRLDRATPADVHPVEAVHPSTPFKWSVVALIGALVAVYGLVVYVVWRTFAAGRWNVEAIVLAQLANQDRIAIGLLVLLGILILAIVYAATQATFSGSIGLASFSMGAAGEPVAPPQPVATVTTTVSAPPPATATTTTDTAPKGDDQ